MKIELKNLGIDEIFAVVQELGFQKYRSNQILSWLYKKDAISFDEMSDLSFDAREKLKEKTELLEFSSQETIKSTDGLIKFSFLLKDGYRIESVYIPEEKKVTLCISTQVGCRFGCLICRTGQMGFKRNLTSGEIIEQIIMMRRSVDPDKKITNLVFMGMGEPLDNYDNLKKALNVITNSKGLDFSPRRITVSTVGYIPNFNKFGNDFPNVGLAVSFNAADNKTRDSIIPLNKKYSIDELTKALKDYPLIKRRFITIEYVMIDGLNDSLAYAHKLAKLLRGLKCKINLISYNDIGSSEFKAPCKENLDQFRQILIDSGYTCITRRSRGMDIKAACGCLVSQ
jgi:23S rRNA (adenine2503-C2)-methyltransferase